MTLLWNACQGEHLLTVPQITKWVNLLNRIIYHNSCECGRVYAKHSYCSLDIKSPSDSNCWLVCSTCADWGNFENRRAMQCHQREGCLLLCVPLPSWLRAIWNASNCQFVLDLRARAQPQLKLFKVKSKCYTQSITCQFWGGYKSFCSPRQNEADFFPDLFSTFTLEVLEAAVESWGNCTHI